LNAEKLSAYSFQQTACVHVDDVKRRELLMSLFNSMLYSEKLLQRTAFIEELNLINLRTAVSCLL
jgi:hypothetical protein